MFELGQDIAEARVDAQRCVGIASCGAFVDDGDGHISFAGAAYEAVAGEDGEGGADDEQHVGFVQQGESGFDDGCGYVFAEEYDVRLEDAVAEEAIGNVKIGECAGIEIRVAVGRDRRLG